MKNLMIIVLGMLLFISCDFHSATEVPDISMEQLELLQTGTHDTLKVVVLHLASGNEPSRDLYVDVTDENFKSIVIVREKDGFLLGAGITLLFIMGFLLGLLANSR